MLSERSGSSGESDDNPGIEQVSERERAYLGSVKAASIAHPEDACENDRNTGEQPTHPQHERLGADHRQGRHPLLQFELECSARPTARNRPNGNEWQKEGRGDLISAESRGNDAVERKEGVGKSRRGAALSARLRVGTNGADE